MIIQFVKDEGLPIVLWGHPHMLLQYLSEWNSSWVTVWCVVKKTTIILLLCMATHTSRQKSFHILQTETQSIN